VNIERYFSDRLNELRSLATRGDPWVFLCASSFIEYLAKIANGAPTGPKEYKDFLRNQFFVMCPRYATFQYASGKSDLADQMYHVLRCGVVHSFSLYTDTKARGYGGRDRSILLAHRRSEPKRSHLDHIVDRRRRPQLDAALFIAEDFVEDIAKVTDHLFMESRRRTPAGMQLRNNLRMWVSMHPPVGSLIL